MPVVDRLMRILFLGLMLLGASTAAVAGGDVWPSASEGWWKSLKGGEKAIYEMVLGTSVSEVEISIFKIKGSRITYSTRDWVGGHPLRGRQRTVDVAKENVGALPKGYKVKKSGSSSLKVGDRDLECNIFDVEVSGVKSKEWHSSRMPPIFNKGVVKMETISAGQVATLTLKSYTGPLIGQ